MSILRHIPVLLAAALALTLSVAQAGEIPDAGAAWEALSTSPVRVECATVAGAPWCRSFGTISAPLDAVSGALRDMRSNADKFQSVVRIDIISADTLRVVLDYPSPLSDRDYVARYTFREEGGVHRYTWQPVPNAAPEESGVVRLPDFAGEWRLEATADGKTRVRYTWQAAIHGSFPELGYSTAWKRAGYEALHDLAQTQGAALSAE